MWEVKGREEEVKEGFLVGIIGWMVVPFIDWSWEWEVGTYRRLNIYVPSPKFIC